MPLLLPARAAVGALLLTASLAACGSDEGLSAEEYREEANTICREGNERGEEITSELADQLESGETPSEDELKDVLGRALDEIEGQMDDIEDLDGPSDLESDVDDVLAEARDALDDVRDRVEDDPVALLQTEEDPFAGVNDRLEELGLEECAG